MKNNDFAVFILTHGRPNNVITYDTLRRQGYTGKIYIVIDNEDKTSEEYYENFGDMVVMFDKADIETRIDTGSNFGDRRTILHARNASFEIAEKLGLTYFLQLDDDYTKFEFRINKSFKYPENHFILQNTLDSVIDLYLDFFKSITAKSIAVGQGGDFISGSETVYKATNKRKCMNTFFCSTERPFKFLGTMNEDVNTYTSFQSMGNLMLTIPFVSITQNGTQSSAGGITELYKRFGTYAKSFYTVMYAPSCTKIGMMGTAHKRLHHSINWKSAVPCIVSEDLRKLKDHTGKEPVLLDNG